MTTAQLPPIGSTVLLPWYGDEAFTVLEECRDGCGGIIVRDRNGHEEAVRPGQWTVIGAPTHPEAPAVEWSDCTEDEYNEASDAVVSRRIITTRHGEYGSDETHTYQVDAAWLAKHSQPAKPWEVLPDGLYVIKAHGAASAAVVLIEGSNVTWSDGSVISDTLRAEVAAHTWTRIPDQPCWTPGELNR